MPSITGNKLHLKLNEIIRPNSVRRIQNQGLPYPKEPTKRGDLIVTFEIKFPENLTEETKQVLWDCLP